MDALLIKTARQFASRAQMSRVFRRIANLPYDLFITTCLWHFSRRVFIADKMPLFRRSALCISRAQKCKCTWTSATPYSLAAGGRLQRQRVLCFWHKGISKKSATVQGEEQSAGKWAALRLYLFFIGPNQYLSIACSFTRIELEAYEETTPSFIT